MGGRREAVRWAVGSATLGGLVAAGALLAGGAGAAPPGAAYCRSQGGTVEQRFPAYSTNNPPVLRLAGSTAFCRFRSAKDGSRIWVDLRTLTATRPTLAALAYLEKPPTPKTAPNVNPASVYCTKIGGSDQFGGANAAGGGWVSPAGGTFAVLQACVFPDLSIIDSFGLAYHANGIVRGADLTTKLRYRSADPPPVFR